MNSKRLLGSWLVLLLAAAAACGDDDGGGDGGDTLCGDGLVRGTEECDGDAFGTDDCTTVGEFSGGTLACSSDCTFDTTGCTASDDCGNGVIDEGEDCDGAELGDASCDQIDDFTGGTLACSDACAFDTGGCVTSEASQFIADARATPDGAGLTLPIAEAVVTYIKPGLGKDPAGVFIQVEQVGPALFIAIAAATLNPDLAVGDEVSFTITEMTTLAGLRAVLAVIDFSIDANGIDVTALVQDVSADATLVSGLDNLDSELITLDATIAGDFTPAGNPAVAAPISTAGVPFDPDSPNLRLRLDGALRESLDLTNGCTVTVGPTPLWRFNAVAQASVWDASDITVNTCPAPQVVTATATGETTVVVTFDRAIDPLSVAPVDFTFTDGLNAVSTAVASREVTVTTNAQTAENEYTVTVAGVTDLLGTAIDPAADTATFTGFGTAEVVCDDGLDNDADSLVDCFDPDCAASAACQFESQLYIWEVDADTPDVDAAEFVEIWNNTGAAVDLDAQGWYVMLVNGGDLLSYNVVRLGPGTLADDGVWVLGSSTVANVDQEVFTTDGVQNGEEGVLLFRCDACLGEGDFSADGNDFDPGTAATFQSDSGATATKLDAVAYDVDDPDNEPLWAKLLDVIAQFNENELDDGANDSNQRTSLGGWLPVTPTPGAFD